VGDCLDGLAAVAADAGSAERAGVLAGAADRMRADWGRPPSRRDRVLHGLPETACARGRTMSVDEALEFAHASID
jgi:hypothetical protein